MDATQKFKLKGFALEILLATSTSRLKLKASLKTLSQRKHLAIWYFPALLKPPKGSAAQGTLYVIYHLLLFRLLRSNLSPIRHDFSKVFTSSPRWPIRYSSQGFIRKRRRRAVNSIPPTPDLWLQHSGPSLMCYLKVLASTFQRDLNLCQGTNSWLKSQKRSCRK